MMRGHGDTEPRARGHPQLPGWRSIAHDLQSRVWHPGGSREGKGGCRERGERRDLLLPKTLPATPPQVAGAERLIWRQGSTDCLGKVTFDRCQVQTRSSQYSHPPDCLPAAPAQRHVQGGGQAGQGRGAVGHPAICREGKCRLVPILRHQHPECPLPERTWSPWTPNPGPHGASRGAMTPVGHPK